MRSLVEALGCWEHLLAMLWPPACAACDEPVAPSEPFCATCDAKLERTSLIEDLAGGLPLHAAAGYAGPAARAIARLKYAGRADLAPRLALLLLRVSERARITPRDCLVPVPLHPRRLAERGYNQSGLLARALARETGARFAPLALMRVRDTPRQAALPRATRLNNLAGAIAVSSPLPRAPVVLIDDVVTTGTTVAACVSAMRAAGANVRAVVTLARTAEEAGAAPHPPPRISR